MATAKENTKKFHTSEIPVNWTAPEFGDVFDFLKTFSFSRELLTNEPTIDKIRCIHYGDIHATYENEILDFENESNVPYLLDGIIETKSFAEANFPALRDGDLIIADASEDYEGICDCVELKNLNGTKAISGLHTFAARASEKKIALGYRTYTLLHEQVVRELRRIATGTSVYGVSKTSLSKVRIPLPPLPEQRAIAKILSTADAAIHTTEKLIAQKELQKKWLMQQLLTGKKRLKGFKAEWISHPVSTLFNPTYRYIEWHENDLYNLISIRRRNGGVFFREPLHGYEIGVKKLKQVAIDDFVISKRQVSHGAWAVIDHHFEGTKISDEYDSLTITNPNLLKADFWKWYIQIPVLTHYANVDSDGVHIEKSIFDYDQFKKRKVQIPSSTKEQTAIAQFLRVADDEIRLLKAKSEKLREQKNGLMQQLLTGKKRLLK